MTSRARWAALLWASSVQFFIVQIAVALTWATPYNLSTRYISDLGNTACAPYPHDSVILVCSPGHAWMNASFVLLGLTMTTGGILVSGAFQRRWSRAVGLGLIALAGVGVFLVGLFPENENIGMHAFGAGINFICGNSGMIVLGSTGLVGPANRVFNRTTTGMGVIGLLGTALFVSGSFLGIGPGGMERVAAYPLTVWLSVAGLVLLLRHSSLSSATE